MNMKLHTRFDEFDLDEMYADMRDNHIERSYYPIEDITKFVKGVIEKVNYKYRTNIDLLNINVEEGETVLYEDDYYNINIDISYPLANKLHLFITRLQEDFCIYFEEVSERKFVPMCQKNEWNSQKNEWNNHKPVEPKPDENVKKSNKRTIFILENN